VTASGSNPILLYDGVCALCNRLVQFTLRHDRRNVFRFAPLQSSYATRILDRHGASTVDLDTFYVVVCVDQPTEYLLARSDALAYVLQELGGVWPWLGRFWKFLPLACRDALYRWIAQNRYMIFGKLDSCPVPNPEDRLKFLEI
jgi:predicted DCC family thiol-disulfide oxidoreductase YuxK